MTDLRFVIGAVLAVALLGVTAFGLTAAMHIAHQAKVGPLESSRMLAYSPGAEQRGDAERGPFADIPSAAASVQPLRPAADAVVLAAAKAMAEAVPAAPEEAKKEPAPATDTDAVDERAVVDPPLPIDDDPPPVTAEPQMPAAPAGKKIVPVDTVQSPPAQTPPVQTPPVETKPVVQAPIVITPVVITPIEPPAAETPPVKPVPVNTIPAPAPAVEKSASPTVLPAETPAEPPAKPAAVPEVEHVATVTPPTETDVTAKPPPAAAPIHKQTRKAAPKAAPKAKRPKVAAKPRPRARKQSGSLQPGASTGYPVWKNSNPFAASSKARGNNPFWPGN